VFYKTQTNFDIAAVDIKRKRHVNHTALIIRHAPFFHSPNPPLPLEVRATVQLDSNSSFHYLPYIGAVYRQFGSDIVSPYLHIFVFVIICDRLKSQHAQPHLHLRLVLQFVI
jgi:hypothetical protein